MGRGIAGLLNARRFFLPVACGDFRLEADGEARCVLTVEDPTPADLAKLRRFLPVAREKGWITLEAGIQPTGLTRIPVDAPIIEAGPELTGVIYMPRTPLWLVVRQVDGEVSVLDVEAHRLREEAKAEKARQEAEAEARRRNQAIRQAADEAEREAKEREAKEREAKERQAKERDAELARIQPTRSEPSFVDRLADAVVTRQPQRGCPAPLPAARRASEVLQAFCTPQQIQEMQAYGRMRVIGGVSGRAYHVYHRNEANRRGLGHCVVDCATGRELCVWDMRVPAEEEVLSMKIAIEHREAWLRADERTNGHSTGTSMPIFFGDGDGPGHNGVLNRQRVSRARRTR